MATGRNGSSQQSIRHLVDHSERFGAVGSPSTTSQLTIDIFGRAIDRKLVGELGILRYTQDGKDHYALGQITEVTMRNAMLEQAIGRGIVRERERWDAVQARQDTHTATMSLSAVFAVEGNSIQPSILGTVPSTGTSVHLVNDDLLRALLQSHQSEIFYLGRLYGSKPLLPMWFKHFDTGVGGAGEAYHIGIFGKTGSGKSVLAKMILTAYARHKGMGLFVLDPQGEFAKGIQVSQLELGGLPMGAILNTHVLQKFDRTVKVYDINKLILDRWEIFREFILRFGFFEHVGIKSPQYQSTTAEYVEEHLKNQQKTNLKDLHKDETLNEVLEYVSSIANKIYAQEDGANRVRRETESAKTDPVARSKWRQITNLFAERQGAERVDRIVELVFSSAEQSRPIVIIDLSQHPQDIPHAVWEEEVKPLLIHRFLQAVIYKAEQSYRNNRSLNTLVVVDEAHRLAPRERVERERWSLVKSTLVDAVRTTRKYGLGWMFISQTLSSLDRDIVSQLRLMFFGFGLGSGTELQALRELVGGEREYLKLYQSFRDPHSAFGDQLRSYSFMVLGPASPLSFSGAPLFFDAFTNADDFLQANNIRL